MAASAPVIRVIKIFVTTNDLKSYLNSVSGVDTFWVSGHLDTARCGAIMSVELRVGLRHSGSTSSAVIPKTVYVN
jgi:hypothetical protein